MAIVIPVTRRIFYGYEQEDIKSTLPINILDRNLTMYDEELIQEMARYRPRTRLREGDFVILTGVPGYMKKKEELPHCWKVRFVVTSWAYDLMRMYERYGGRMSIMQARQALQRAAGVNRYNPSFPMVFGHGYPHGENPDTVEWLPEPLLKRTIYNEATMEWTDIVDESGAAFLGYDTHEITTPFTFDYAPDQYSSGNKGRPFRAEERLVQMLYEDGLEELLHLPIKVKNPKIAFIDPEHDIFQVTDLNELESVDDEEP